LNLVADVFRLQNIYSYITLDIKKVGPIEFDNFLVVFDLASRVELHKTSLKILKQLLLYIMITAVIIGCILIF
jgi:type III secretory pathway component EscU